MSGYISSFICNILTLPYPIFASFKAIESLDKEDDKQWLTFWIVWASAVLVESFTNIFIYWIPLYFEIKLGFFLLLQTPFLNLSGKIYEWYIKQYLLQRRLYLDEIIKNTLQYVLGVLLLLPFFLSQIVNPTQPRSQQQPLRNPWRLSNILNWTYRSNISILSR
jgi:hypothetical protein